MLYRSWREGRAEILGFAEDYACLIQGLLDLYEAGFDIHWLQWAEKLQGKMNEQFWDAARGGYFNSRVDDPTVIVRLREDYDGAEPAANSVAAGNLVRLDWMIGLAGAGDKARQTVEALRPQWSRAPQALPQMLCAMELVLAEPRTVVLAGDPAAPDFQAMAAVLHREPGRRRVLLRADQGDGQKWLAARRPYLADLRLAGGAAAYLCENSTCRPPVQSAADLMALLG